MPRNLLAKVIPSAFEPHFDQIPLTRFRDLECAFNIEVLEYPDKRSLETLYEFMRACHSANGPTKFQGADKFHKSIIEYAEEIFAGGSLWQGMEKLNFTILITGCSRVFTHQLVRQRIGVTFSQKCTGECDWRHHDILIPRIDKKAQDLLISHGLITKGMYTQMVDSKKVSLQDARYILGHNWETFIYAHLSGATIAALYNKRICTMSQAWETHIFAEKLREAILDVAPYMAPALENPCDKGRCWHAGAGDNFNVTRLYAPDKQHDKDDWNPKSFIYGERTHFEMSSGTMAKEFKTKCYRGEDLIEEKEWKNLLKLYKQEAK